jgi:large subunit ribosomal protein L4
VLFRSPEEELTWLSLRNLQRVHLIAPGQLNTYDVVVSDDVIFTQEALEEFLAGPIAAQPGKEPGELSASDDAAPTAKQAETAKQADAGQEEEK